MPESSVNSLIQDYESTPLPGFGSRVQALRKAAGMTQAALASQIGRSTTAVTAWENDKRPPEGGHMLVRLAAVLNTSVDYLLTERRPAGLDEVIEGLEDLLAAARRLRVGAPAAVDAEPEETLGEDKSA